jgi:cytochrome c
MAIRISRFPLAANILVVAIVAISGSAMASEELAKKSGCNACHAQDKKSIGPSFKQIQEKYATQKDASDFLAGKIKNGSMGVWGGAIPMPANANIKESDAKTLADWIMVKK